jgi:hypothetical protein
MYDNPEIPASTQGIAVIALVLVVLAAFALAPSRDPSKTIPGIPCSVLSETEISGVVGTPVRLVPTTGTTCRYVALNDEASRSVVVTANRAHPRGYHVTVIAPKSDPSVVTQEETRLAGLIHARGTQALARQ